MFFAQLKSAVRSLRFRLMVWNAIIMLLASLGVLWGLREGVRYTLVTELDDNLQDDLNEVSEVLVSVFEADNPFFQMGMDRKARGHKQRSWFLQVADLRTPEQREQYEQRRREWARRFGRPRGRPNDARPNDARPNDARPNDARPNDARPPESTPAGAPNANDASSPAGNPSSEAKEGGAKGGESRNNEAQVNVAKDNSGRENSSRDNSGKDDSARLVSDVGPVEAKLDKEAGPPIMWQTFNVPDWSMHSVPKEFHKFNLPDGVATTVDHYRVIERTIPQARGGPVRVRLGASIRSIQHAAETTDRLMLINVLVALVMAPLGGYWLALRATRPLKEMIHTADRLRPQEMQERLPLSSTDDEIDQLSRSFNRLLDRIAEYLTKRQDMLANSAHELRTPLAALRSTAELALSSPRSVDEYCELLESIVSECGNLEQLVNQLLLLSETESAHFESRGEIVDLSKITTEACEMFGAVAESRDIVLDTKIAEGIEVDGSRLHLRQLLNNLIDNAIKFIPGTGRVTVELNTSDGANCLRVSDTGVGIADEEQKHLFERFYRGDKSRRRNTPTRGTGLGLSICRAITEAHGGAIEVMSQPGEGTTFTVTLPRRQL